MTGSGVKDSKQLHLNSIGDTTPTEIAASVDVSAAVSSTNVIVEPKNIMNTENS